MRNRFIVLAAVISAITVWLTPSVAQASVATSCLFDAGTATVTAVFGSGESATLIRNGSAIEFGGSACGAATVTNTDQINIDLPDQNTTESLTISMANGAFAPGKTPEGDGSDEIEIAVTGLWSGDEQLTFVGTGGDDTITVGFSGADLVPGTAGEQEVTYPGAANTKEVDAGAGNDTVWMERAYSSIVNAGDGDDSILAGCFADSTYDGGAGTDTMDFSACDVPFGVTVHALGGGSATAKRDGGGTPGTDALSGIEEIIGSAANDTFYGSTGPDQFVGGDGNDWFLPWGGDDTIDGGRGYDTMTTGASTEPVTFDMSAEQATGEGTDTFANVEILQGSPGNDRFTGDPRTSGVIAVDGYGGRDVVDLRRATHRQFVWTSPVDALASAPGEISLFAQDIRRIRGSNRADRIEVGSLNGQEMRARFRGEGGDDRLLGGIYGDVLDGGPGNDVLNGAQGRDTCIGGSGDVVLNCEVLSR
jgi:Ca2+-binding RTX toxin-like protein